jgi:signal recognition particle subunit SRP54
MGGMQGIMGMLPGVQKMKKQIADSGVTEKTFKRQEAIITSMTPNERRKPDVLNASRKRRIAAGAGVDVSEINRLLKQHRQMADTVKMMSRGGGKNMARMAQALGMGQMPGMPKGVTPPAGMMGGMGGGMGPGGFGGLGGPGGGIDLNALKALGGGARAPDGSGAGPLPGLGGGLPQFPKKK